MRTYITCAVHRRFIYFTDKPFCVPDQPSVFGALVGRSVRVPCAVAADPANADGANGLAFSWSFNTSSGSEEMPDEFLENTNKRTRAVSTLTFVPKARKLLLRLSATPRLVQHPVTPVALAARPRLHAAVTYAQVCKLYTRREDSSSSSSCYS